MAGVCEGECIRRSPGDEPLTLMRCHSFGIYASCIPPYKSSPFTTIMYHSPCMPDIQTSFLQAVFHGTIHLLRGLPTEQPPAHSYIDSLSNPVVLHSLYMAEPSKNTFINPFVHPPSLPCTTPLSVRSGLYPSS